MKQSALATCVSMPSIMCSFKTEPLRARRRGANNAPPSSSTDPGQAFNAFCGVSSTWIKYGLAVSAFGSVIVSTPRS